MLGRNLSIIKYFNLIWTKVMCWRIL